MSAPETTRPLAPTDRWEAWDRLVEGTPAAGFMQSSWWADFRTTAAYDHFATILRTPEGIVGGAVVLRYEYDDERCFYYLPEGPVLPDDEEAAAQIFEAVLAAIEEHRRADPLAVSHLRIEPRWQRLPAFVQGFAPIPAFRDGYMEPRTTLCVDLRPPEDEILAQMKPKGRYNIGVARRHGVTVVEDTSERGVANFLAIYEATTDRQHIDAKPPTYFEDLIALLVARGRGSVFFAEHQGARLAAAIVLYFGCRATYFYGGSLTQERRVMAPYLLHFEIMRRAKALGHRWYDLWGIAPDNVPDHPWQDITAFKRKFGGVAVTLVPTLDCVYDSDAYQHYLARKR